MGRCGKAVNQSSDCARERADRPGRTERDEVAPLVVFRSRRGELAIERFNRRNEAISVLRHFDETRPARIIAELAAKRLDALGQRFVGDRDALPDFGEEAVFGNELAAFADQQASASKYRPLSSTGQSSAFSRRSPVSSTNCSNAKLPVTSKTS